MATACGFPVSPIWTRRRCPGSFPIECQFSPSGLATTEKESKPDAQKVDKALMVLKKLQEVQENGDEITNKDLDEVSMELKELQAD